MKVLLAAIFIGLALSASAALTEAEKNLLTSSISADSATQMGKANDAEGLARIIALGDANLVSSFSRAMPRTDPLSPAIESLVVKHFDDPRVGAALRALALRYQTRALFDLFYAAAQAAVQARDPVFEQILRTDQPGIDEAVLRLAPKFQSNSYSGNPALIFLGNRKYPGAVEALIAALAADDRGEGYGPTLHVLLHYDSPEVWRRTSEGIERMHRDGQLTDNAYKRDRAELDTALKNPETEAARHRQEENMAAYIKRRNELSPLLSEASHLRSDPPRYIVAQAKYLGQLDAFATNLGDRTVISQVSREYLQLGMVALLRANDPKAAVASFERAVNGVDVFAAAARADTLEQGLADKAAAIRAYENALGTIRAYEAAFSKPPPPGSGPPGDTENNFYREWFSAEIEYLRTGKPFRARVSEPAITGFWMLVNTSRNTIFSVAQALRDATPPRATVTTRVPSPPAPAPTQVSGGFHAFAIVSYDDSGFRGDWEKAAERYSYAAGPEAAEWLAKLPPSRMSLLVSLREVSALDDAAAILSQLARDDPSGFWSAILMGSVEYHETHGRDGALDDGVANYLPGMAAPGKPNPLAVAAKRFMQSRGLRVLEKK